MKKISDRELIRSYIEKDGIDRYFDTADIEFQAFSYEKGEFLGFQGERTPWLQFIVDGSVSVYGIREDGSLTPVNAFHAPGMIGDVEIYNHGVSPFYSEASSRVVTLALSVDRYRPYLDSDVQFLHLLLKSYAEKILLISTLDLPAQNLEERVMLYLASSQTPDEIHGMEKASLSLHCSRRQLQRVLKKLCDEKKLEKTGRGSYRPLKAPATPSVFL